MSSPSANRPSQTPGEAALENIPERRGTVRPCPHSYRGRTFPAVHPALQPCKVGTTRTLHAGGFLFNSVAMVTECQNVPLVM